VGFDTVLQDGGGDGVPPGLRQRIAIARALAPKPRIVLFDNADRALDRSGYAMIYTLLARLKKHAAMILVTDDQNIRALADREMTLDHGTLAEAGQIAAQSSVLSYRELRN